MRKRKWLTLALVVALLPVALCGCGTSMQVENQAYALVMGLDRSADGQLQMCMLIPKIAGNSAEAMSSAEGGGGGSGNYTRLEVRGQDFESTLEKMSWAAPRRLNLSQLKLIVLSRELAEEVDNLKLMRNIAQTERLFTAARVAVCLGSARAFVAAIQPNMGMRLSTDIEATLDHYVRRGFIPGGSLAEIYYQTESVYSDPMAICAVLDEEAADEAEAAAPAFAFENTIEEVSASNDSEIATRYLGAAVFADGRMCGVLNAQQTVLANLLHSSVESFHYEFSGQSIELLPMRTAFVRVDTDSEPARIRVSLRLSISAQDRLPDEGALGQALSRDIQELFHTAQQMNAEPFGFAEKAALHFPTLDQWIEYDWRERFRHAELELELLFAHSDA